MSNSSNSGKFSGFSTLMDCPVSQETDILPLVITISLSEIYHFAPISSMTGRKFAVRSTFRGNHSCVFSEAYFAAITRLDDTPDGASSISDIAAGAASRDPIGETAFADFASGLRAADAAASEERPGGGILQETPDTKKPGHPPGCSIVLGPEKAPLWP